MRRLLTRIRKVSLRFAKFCLRPIKNLVLQEKPVLVKSEPRLIQPPVVVYQMGKVGSSSVTQALRTVGRRVFHVHVLNPEQLAAAIKRHQREGMLLSGNIRQSLYVTEKFLDKGRPIKIITAARDPIARNISAYFQVLPYFRSLKQEFEEDELQLMMEEFLKKYRHELPLIWFDREIKATLGVDVYNYPFPKHEGVQRIQAQERDILLLKAEAADHLKVAAIKEFLQIPEFSLEARNVGKGKAYAHYYQPFLERIQLPAAYLDRMYNSRYAQHFYTSEELQQFRQRWTRSQVSSQRRKGAQQVSCSVGNDEHIQQAICLARQDKDLTRCRDALQRVSTGGQEDS